MKINYVVREYREGNEVQINELFNKVFQEKRTLREWEWKFKQNPYRDLHLITVAEDAGKIVGHYASIPVFMQCGSERFLFAYPVDTFVHPDYRNLKIISDLYSTHKEIGAKRGYIGAFGFPNEQAYMVGKRLLGYYDLLKLSNLYCRLNWRQPVKRRLKGIPVSLEKAIQKASSKYYSVYFSQRPYKLEIIDEYIFDERINRLWERVHQHFSILCIRDLPYLTWRYMSNPLKAYNILAVGDEEINGYLVYRIRENNGAYEGVIVDCLWDDEAVLKALLTDSLQRFAREGVDYAILRAQKATAFYNVATQLGFRERGGIEDIPVVYHLITHNEILEKAVKDPALWYFTYGDSDGI